MTKTPTSAPELAHRQGCPGERVERTDHPSAEVTSWRCCDCGAYVAVDGAGRTLDSPAVTGGLANVRAEPDGGIVMRSTSRGGRV